MATKITKIQRFIHIFIFLIRNICLFTGESLYESMSQRHVLSLTLPYPPSANRIWRVARGRIVLSDEARLYRFRVAAAVMNQIGFQRSIADPVRVTIQVFPPDRKRRDIDNIFKATLDALTHAKVWNDDSQVKRVVVEMCEPEKGGSLKIGITASPLGPPCD